MRLLAITLTLTLGACAAPAYYTQLEDIAFASDCVAQMTGQEPHEILPFVVYRDEPFWVTHKGKRRKVNGTWRRTGDVRIITIARGSHMAETLFHELGHDYGLSDENDEAESLVRRMKECLID